MTYKKNYKYRKTIKRKKRGGAALLNTLSKGTGVANAISGTGNASKLATSGVATAISGTGLATVMSSTGTKLMGSESSLVKKIPIKPPKSPYMMVAEFILKQFTKSRLNFSLASKVFKSPVLIDNKYKNQIKQLSQKDNDNFKCACKLIYLYYYDEYVQQVSFKIDNSQEIDNMCQLFYILDQQILLFNSSKKKAQTHFNEVFNNDNFINLYKQIKPDDDCNIMKNKIQSLFKIGENDYSYIILYLLHDLLNQKHVIFINIMDELKKNNQTKRCNFSKEVANIIENCEEKQQYELQLKLINPI